MNAALFVAELKRSAPDKLDLLNCGYPEEEAVAFLKSFECISFEKPRQNPGGVDPLLDLLRNWDLQSVTIGMVHFETPQIVGVDLIGCGYCEADPLVLDKTGEVITVEYGTNSHVLWHVAANGSAFLDAILKCARFFASRATEKIEFDDFEQAAAASVDCALAAGGFRYHAFYKMLLAAE